ncbi:trypsin-like protease, partial [Dimargaris cristalligena]
IITAAHCVTDKNTGRVYSPSNFYFTVGQLSADFTDEYTASSITVHPDFDHERVVNDIALVKLTKPISLSTSVQPIRIWTNQVTTGLTATAIGWGSTDGVDTSQQATTLEYVNVTISNDQKKCIRLASQFVDSDQDVICTANNPGRDTCQGDSGGPL